MNTKMEVSVAQGNGRLAKRGWADPQYLTTDLVLFTVEDRCLKVLLVRRANEPFKGYWALPGCFVLTKESLDQAASRLLREKTGTQEAYLEQLFTFGDTRRGPALRVVTTAYFGLAPVDGLRSNPTGGPHNTRLLPVQDMPRLGFDHNKIVGVALERLRHKVNYTTICHCLLGHRFTLPDLQEVYEIILDQRLDKRNFRKKMLQLGILKDLRATRQEPMGRPARLYAFARQGVVKLQERGILVPF